jgi:hypothetical protein
LRWGINIILPGLALIPDPQNLYLLSSWDYRHVPPYLPSFSNSLNGYLAYFYPFPFLNILTKYFNFFFSDVHVCLVTAVANSHKFSYMMFYCPSLFFFFFLGGAGEDTQGLEYTKQVLYLPTQISKYFVIYFHHEFFRHTSKCNGVVLSISLG